MYLRLEPTSGVPLGVQIVRQIRLMIASGRIKAGEKLPSARDLAARLQVNFHTVRKAYGELEAESVLRFERGRGTYVADGARRLSAEELRRLVRGHVERLAADLAGLDSRREDLEALVVAELQRALRRPKEDT